MTDETTSLEKESTPTSQGSSKGQPRRRFVLTNTQILLIPILIFGGMLVLDFRQRVIEGQQMISEQEELAAQIAELEAEQRQLEASKAYYSSDAYVEAWAHSQGKMVQSGEVLIVPLPDGAPIAEVPRQQGLTTTPETASQPNEPLISWRIWWSLFFDAEPPFTSTAEQTAP